MKGYLLPILLFGILITVLAVEAVSPDPDKMAADKAFATYLAVEPKDTVWRGNNKYQIPVYGDSGKLIMYGRELIANTAYYLGPKGTVAQNTNGMNCQNCHIDAGTVPYGNNFGKVYPTYPLYKARNNGMQGIYDRVNDCFERSLNGKAMDSTTHEMKAIFAYIKWLGDGTQKGDAKGGTSIMKLENLDIAADPTVGNQIYNAQCKNCHGDKGQGQLDIVAGTGYSYPPLWGEHSYNDGAGLYRLSSFAGFVKANMPFGTDYHSPKLTDEEAWDVAAFVNSQPRPHKDQTADWNDISKKPIDFPFGPYIDPFSEKQHKYGPFKRISDYLKSIKQKT